MIYRTIAENEQQLAILFHESLQCYSNFYIYEKRGEKCDEKGDDKHKTNNERGRRSCFIRIFTNEIAFFTLKKMLQHIFIAK